MPQIKTEHRGAMVNFLNARGVTHTEEDVDPGTLLPSEKPDPSPTPLQETWQDAEPNGPSYVPNPTPTLSPRPSSSLIL